MPRDYPPKHARAGTAYSAARKERDPERGARGLWLGMQGILELSSELEPVGMVLAQRLLGVQACFDRQLQSDLPPVRDLCRHIERYRGKMLRPTLVLLCGLAAAEPTGMPVGEQLREAHEMVGAVCEMVHMATLVHDDVLDDADVRRRGETVNRLHGNEAAVILGDYLIASAYHLCSRIDAHSALAVAGASAVMCGGELLQLHHRNDLSLDEPTYFEIVERKTAALISVACELGAYHTIARTAPHRSGDIASIFAVFGRAVGVAFQIQDDVLDLTGEESVVGKSLHKDLEKGKLTLPVIHHLGVASDSTRGQTLRLLESVAEHRASPEAILQLARAVHGTGSIEYARATARRYVATAKGALGAISPSPALRVLTLLADAVVTRDQ